MLASERRKCILERVAERQTTEMQALADELGVSEMTIRRAEHDRPIRRGDIAAFLC